MGNPTWMARRMPLPGADRDQQTFTEVITDTMCGKAHGMVAGQPDDKCIAMCVKGTSSQDALYDGKSVLKLTDQKTSARYPAQHVKGHRDPK